MPRLQFRNIKLMHVFFVTAICALTIGIVIFGGKPNSPVTAICGDCRGHIPIQFSDLAATRLRREWRGVGKILTISFSIPDANITIDGIDLEWHGDCLVRRDFPSKGYDMYWDFPTGKKVSTLKRRRFSNKILELIAELELAQSK